MSFSVMVVVALYEGNAPMRRFIVFCPTERTEIFTPHCGAFLSFLSFLWDFYYTMRIVFYCPTEIKEIAEIIVTGPREVLSALSAGHYYLMRKVFIVPRK